MADNVFSVTPFTGSGTVSYTFPAGLDSPVMVACVSVFDNARGVNKVTNITYNGIPMLTAAAQEGIIDFDGILQDFMSGYIFYLPNPPEGAAHDIVLTLQGTYDRIIIQVVALQGISVGPILGSNARSIQPTFQLSEITIDYACIDENSLTISVGSNLDALLFAETPQTVINTAEDGIGVSENIIHTEVGEYYPNSTANVTYQWSRGDPIVQNFLLVAEFGQSSLDVGDTFDIRMF